jgi:hypothetical protein
VFVEPVNAFRSNRAFILASVTFLCFFPGGSVRFSARQMGV